MKRIITTLGVVGVLAIPALAQASRVKVPGTPNGAEVKPYIISWTGDGTAFLGGFTGQAFLSHATSLTAFGRLRWTTYTATEGRAWGADWLNNGIPDDADGTFTPQKANVHVFRPRGGIFTRMTFNLDGRVVTYLWTTEGLPGWIPS